MEFAVAVVVYGEDTPACAEQNIPEGVVPEALLRLQGVGEVATQEVSMWFGKFVTEVQNQGRIVDEPSRF